MGSKREEAAEKRRDSILEAALRVFSNKGFAAATNKDVADAAGMASPGLIYHYFRDKQDLLDKVLERINPLLALIVSSPEAARLPLREGLLLFTRHVLQLAKEPERVAVMRMLVGEALRNQHTARSLFAAGPGRGIKFLAKWLDQHVQQGTLRDMPARQLARQFMAPLFVLVLFRIVFDYDEPVTDDLAERHVDAFLEGATPR